MGCCGGIVGKVFNPVVDAGKDVGSFIDDAVHDVGSFVDDAVNDIIPGGWATLGAAALGAGAVGALGEAAAAEGALLDAAAAEGATAAAEGAAAAEAATVAESAAAAADIAEAASTAGTAAEATGSFGLNPNVGFNFGELNPSVTGTGINTSSLGGMEYLGGAGSLAEGTAGFTADQIATAGSLGQIGTNAASGLGYLGGAASLPSGTAGITGVTTGGLSASDLLKLAKAGKSLLTPEQQYQISSPDGAKLAALVRSGNPFNFAPVTQIQDTKKEITPVYLGQLANLLKG